MIWQEFSGLRFDGKQWTIDKRVKGHGRLFERTGFGKEEAEQAQQRFHALMSVALAEGQRHTAGVMTFNEAAARQLREATKRSVERDMYALQRLVPSIGHLLLAEIHQGTLQPYIEQRRQAGIKSGMIARELTVVRRILTLASRLWRNADNQPYLPVPPLLALPDWEDEAVPYPLSWDEQSALCAALPRPDGLVRGEHRAP
ncbi:MAG: hypothetical protein FJ189_04250 [Gammaproteobacteria bacterium]|nr:hypothetical protein [Gammaproteobacteria bacterium]